jgi:hypothetical protein
LPPTCLFRRYSTMEPLSRHAGLTRLSSIVDSPLNRLLGDPQRLLSVLHHGSDQPLAHPGGRLVDPLATLAVKDASTLPYK